MRRLLVLATLLANCLGSAQTVRLQLKFPMGKSDRLTTETRMSYSIGMPGTSKSMEMKMNQSASMLSRVISSSPQGASVKITYEKMASTMAMAGQPMTQPNSELEKSLKGQSIILVFAPNGKITDVKGMEALMSKSQSGLSPQTQAMFKQLFGKQSIIDSMSMAFGAYPDHPLRVGEGWNANMNFGQAPFRVVMKLRMKLQDLEQRHGHRMARIAITGSGSMDLSGLGAASVKVKTDRFTVSGHSFFDLERGWLSDSSIKMNMHLLMTGSAQGKSQTSAMTLNLTTDSKVAPLK